MKKISSFLLFCAVFFCLISAASAEEKSYKITQVQRGRVCLDGNQWIQLIGVDMRNLSSKKKSSGMFSKEVEKFLRGLTGKQAYLESDEFFASKASMGGDKMGYLYYLEATNQIDPQREKGVAVTQMLMMDTVRTNKKTGQAEVKMTPYIKTMLNIELVRKGYARVDPSKPLKYLKELLLAEREAQLDKVGIWE